MHKLCRPQCYRNPPHPWLHNISKHCWVPSKTPHFSVGRKTSCLKNDITPEICCRKHTASALPKSQRKYKKTTQCQRLHIKFQVGGNENQKQNVKTYFQKKGRPVLNTVHKILAHSSIFLSMKMRPHSDKQQGNTASLKNLSSFFFSF